MAAVRRAIHCIARALWCKCVTAVVHVEQVRMQAARAQWTVVRGRGLLKVLRRALQLLQSLTRSVE
jgi:hypothetical protein